MALPFRITVGLVIVGVMHSPCRVYAGAASPRSISQVSVPNSEGCIPSTVASSKLHGGSATVSVASMLVPHKTMRAYEHAEMALTRKNLGDAEKELKKALLLYPKSAVAWCLMGTVHEEQLQLDRAYTDYSQAVSADSQMLAAYLGLARVAFREQRWQQVTQLTDHLATVNPFAFPVAYLYNAAANFNQGDLTDAEKSARKFQSFDTEHERPQVYLLLGDILTCEGDYAGAANQKQTFLALVPDAYDADEIREQIRVLEDLDPSRDGLSTSAVRRSALRAWKLDEGIPFRVTLRSTMTLKEK